MSARGLVVVGAVFAALASAGASAQPIVPLTAATPSLELGLDNFAGPALRLGFSPAGSALVVARVDVGTRVAGVELGGQWQQRLWGPLSLRESAVVGPFVSALGTPAGGVSVGGLLQLGIDVDESLIVVGPRVFGSALLQGDAPGRGLVDVVAGARVPVSSSLALTGQLGLGVERSHAGFSARGAAIAGTAAIGVQWRP